MNKNNTSNQNVLSKSSIFKKLCAITLLLVLVITVGCSNSINPYTSSNNESNGSTYLIDWAHFNDRASIFIVTTASGDYDVAVEMFDDTMKQTFGAEGLQELWAVITTLAGEFIRIHDIHNETVNGFYIVEAIMQHNESGFILHVTFSGDGLIAGLSTGGTTYLSDAVSGTLIRQYKSKHFNKIIYI